MIVEKLKESVLQIASEGKIVSQNDNHSALDELQNILSDQKDNKKYKYSEVDKKPFNIPDNWVWIKLEDICIKITDGTHSTPKYTTDGIPFISVKDVSSGYISFDDTKFISEEEHKQLYSRCNPEYGDLLITKVGTTGVPAIVETNQQFSLFVSVALLKINCKKIYNKYLYYILQSPVVAKQVKENTRGVGNKNWVLDAIKNTILPLPPLEEQFRIVEKIEEIFTQLDETKIIEDKINLLKISFPDEMRKSILFEAFIGNLVDNSKDSNTLIKVEEIIKKINKNYKPIENNLIPRTWKTFKFGDIFDIINGFTPLRSNEEFWNKNEIPWFTVDDINEQGRIINYTKQFITKKALGKNSKRVLPKDTVLLCCTASVGEYAITKIDLTTNQQFNGLVIKEELKNYIYPMYVFEFVQTLKNKLLASSGKTTFSFLSTKKLAEFEIPIPPLEEQFKIVEKIESLLPLCAEIDNLVNS